MHTGGKRELVSGEYQNILQGLSREELKFSAIKVLKY
jgi:hypothetical protein